MQLKKGKKMRAKAQMALAAAAIVSALTVTNLIAQRNYDPNTVETIEGKVLAIEKTTPAKNRGYGVHLMLQDTKESISVHLGPAWYIDRQMPKIESGDAITVTGSRVTIDGKQAIIAAEIKKGSQTLKLRNDNGVPAWSRGGGGQ